MKIEIINGIRVQFSDDDKWLHDNGNGVLRIFAKKVYLGKNAAEWAECTEEEHQEHLAHNEQVRLEMEKSMEEQ